MTPEELARIVPRDDRTREWREWLACLRHDVERGQGQAAALLRKWAREKEETA